MDCGYIKDGNVRFRAKRCLSYATSANFDTFL